MSLKKLDGQSRNITDEERANLKQLFPEAFTGDKVDFEKLKAALGEEVDLGERYGLSWKGKSNVFRAIQETTTKTLKPVRGESVNFDDTDNLFIEGDNLEALKVLQKAYYGKVKMIYIDPPYNTGNDFVYNDKFAQTQAEYEAEAGIRDDDGKITRTDGLKKNSRDGGHFHSNWLNMMYPRLYLARNLLKQDGVIFVSIDDNEVHNLRMIMNEIFGEENFVAQLVWNSATGGGIRAKYVNYAHQYILCYGKSLDTTESFWAPLSAEALEQYRLEDSRDKYREKDFAWRNSSEGKNQKYFIKCPDGTRVKPKEGYIYRFIEARFKEELANNTVVFKQTKTGPLVDEHGNQAAWNIYIKKYLGDAKGAPVSVLPKSLVGMNDSGTKELFELFGDTLFENPKSVRLMKYILEFGSSDEGLILDFFAGSGTTAHAVMELNAENDSSNRKCISVQLPESTEPHSTAFKADYKTIANLAKERIRRAAKKIHDGREGKLKLEDHQLDLGFKVLKIEDTNFKIWDSNVADPEKLKEQMRLHLDAVKKDTSEEDLLLELMLKVGIEPTTKCEKKSDHWVVGNDLVICLADKIEEVTFAKIISNKPSKIILLDRALHDNDQLKTNLLLQAEKSNIEVLVV